MVRKLLLGCGVASSVLYAGLNVFVPMLWPEYSSVNQTVSELSAIDAPTRNVWFPFGLLYAVLVIAFGLGVNVSAVGSNLIRWLGILLIAYGTLCLYWPPMHLRGTITTVTDTLHLVWAGLSVLLMVSSIILSAVIFKGWFRWYAIVTVLVLAVFGILTSVQAPAVPLNQPTPFMGVWERINIGVYLLWIIVLAVMLYPERKPVLQFSIQNK